MRIWPLSAIRTSPLMASAYASELDYANEYPLSQNCINAVADVIVQTPGINSPNLVFIDTVEGALRRTYTGYPNFEEWSKLERVTRHALDNGRVFLFIDALH